MLVGLIILFIKRPLMFPCQRQLFQYIRNCIVMFLFASPVTCFAQNKDTSDLQAVPQRDVIGLAIDLFNLKQKRTDSVRNAKKVQFSLVPAAGSVAGGGTAIVTAFNAAFYTGQAKTTSLSTVTFTPWFTLNGKFVFPFRNFVWFPDDKYLLKGDTRFMVYPQYTWGLGDVTDNDTKGLIQYDYLRVYQSLLKKVNKEIMIGGGYNFDYHFQLADETDSATASKIPSYDYYTSHGTITTSSGPVLNFLIDQRRNAFNPEKGYYIGFDYRINLEALGSTENWQSIFADARKYFPLQDRKKGLIAAWAYYWGVISGTVPYLDMPSIGWDYNNRSGRGYQQNRYRGEKLVYFESEYRRNISRDGLFGFVLFANVHSVTAYPDSKGFQRWNPAFGTGLRLKFNKISNTNIALDLGASKDYIGLYLGLGEAF